MGDVYAVVWHLYCIVFDNYFKQSIKQHERSRISKSDVIITPITSEGKSLTVDVDAFWASTETKIGFQQMFIRWVIREYKGLIEWYRKQRAVVKMLS